MHATHSVSLNRQPFTFEHPAYTLLTNYLQELEHRLTKHESKQEILEGIEERIAERLHEVLTTSDRTISLEELTPILDKLGKPAEVVGDTPEHQAPTLPHEPLLRKRLYRDTENEVVGGVASGIAAYFDIDPIIIRVLFVITAFWGGFGFLAYFILLIALPEAKTADQKREMRGEPGTAQEIFNAVSSRAKSLGSEFVTEARTTRVRNGLNVFAHFLRELGLVAIKLIGLGLAVLGVIGTVLTTMATVSLYSMRTLSTETGSIEFPIGRAEHLLVATTFLVIALPFIALALAGISTFRKRAGSAITWITLSVLWILAIIGTTAILGRTYTRIQERADQITTSTSTQTTALSPGVTKVISEDGTELEIIYDPSATGSITANANTAFRESEGTLIISHKNASRWSFFWNDTCLGECHTGVTTITLPTLTELEAKDGSSISLSGATLDQLKVHTEDIGIVEVDQAVTTLTLVGEDASESSFTTPVGSADVTLHDISKAHLISDKITRHIRDRASLTSEAIEPAIDER